MKTVEVKVDERVFKIRELYAREIDSIDFKEDKQKAIKQQIQFATGITDDEYHELTVREKMTIQKTMNKINGIDEDFQKPTKE